MTETKDAPSSRPKKTGVEAVAAKASQLMDAIEKLSPADRAEVQRKIHRGTGETMRELIMNLRAVSK